MLTRLSRLWDRPCRPTGESEVSVVVIDATKARKLLAGIRLVNGALALVAPQFLLRRLGADPDRDPSGIYPFRDRSRKDCAPIGRMNYKVRNNFLRDCLGTSNNSENMPPQKAS